MKLPSNGWAIGISRRINNNEGKDISLFIPEEDGLTEQNVQKLAKNLFVLIKEYEETHHKGHRKD